MPPRNWSSVRTAKPSGLPVTSATMAAFAEADQRTAGDQHLRLLDDDLRVEVHAQDGPACSSADQVLLGDPEIDVHRRRGEVLRTRVRHQNDVLHARSDGSVDRRHELLRPRAGLDIDARDEDDGVETLIGRCKAGRLIVVAEPAFRRGLDVFRAARDADDAVTGVPGDQILNDCFAELTARSADSNLHSRDLSNNKMFDRNLLFLKRTARMHMFDRHDHRCSLVDRRRTA